MSYVIEKKVDGEWSAAWGLKHRSYPKAATDEEAIGIFERETAKCRTPYRLVRKSAYAYSVTATVLATNSAAPA